MKHNGYNFSEADGGNGDCDSDISSDVKYKLQRTISRTRQLSSQRNLSATRKSKKLADKRAHINRNNWDDKLTAALIAQVELHPVIWDVNSSGFRNKSLRDYAWLKVRTDGHLTHINDAECRRKWQHIYNNNNKLANAYYATVSGESAKKIPNWQHWAAMEFIRQNRALYNTHTQSNSQEADNESLPLAECSSDDKTSLTKQPVSTTLTKTTTPTATSGTLQMQDALIETIGEGHFNPHLAESKEWAVVLNQMLPMHAARAKSEIKTILSKYLQRSAAAENETAEKVYRSELAKTSLCIPLSFVDCGVTESVFVLGNDLEKLDLSRHTKVIVFKENGELLTNPTAIKNVEIAVGLRQSTSSDTEQPEIIFTS